MTPDPYSGSASAKDPGSWNKYSYTAGDPANRSDPGGLDWAYDGSGWYQTFDADCTDNAFVCGYWYGVSQTGQATAGYIPSIFASDLGSATAGDLLAFSGAYDVGDPGWGSLAAAPPTPPQSDCSISVYARPVALGPIGGHRYIFLTGPEFGPNGLMIEGGPDNNAPAGGRLTTSIAPPGQGLAATTPTPSNPADPSNSQIGNSYNSADACSKADSIRSAALAYTNPTTLVPYLAIPWLPGTYNSNAYTNTLLTNVGLNQYFGDLGVFASGNFFPGSLLTVPPLRRR